MRKYTGIDVFLLLSSCASLVYQDTTKVNVFTKQKDVRISFEDTSIYVYSPATIVVERSNKPLLLTLRKDSVSKIICLPTKLNDAFIYGNIFNFTYGMGHLYDLTNNRGFSYPKNVYADLDNPDVINVNYKSKVVPNNSLSQKFKESIPSGKGSIGIKLFFPTTISSFFLNKATEPGELDGIFGMKAELDYRYTNDKFFGVGCGSLTFFSFPFLEYFTGESKYANGEYLDVLHGHKLKDVTFSYGLSLQKLTYEKRSMEVLNSEYIDRLLFYSKENRLGLSLSAAYNVTKGFSVGVKYLPSFYTLTKNEFRYGHL